MHDPRIESRNHSVVKDIGEKVKLYLNVTICVCSIRLTSLRISYSANTFYAFPLGEYNEIEVFHNGDDATISNLDTNTEYVFSIRVNTAQGPGKSSQPLVCKTSESCTILKLYFKFEVYRK